MVLCYRNKKKYDLHISGVVSSFLQVMLFLWLGKFVNDVISPRFKENNDRYI